MQGNVLWKAAAVTFVILAIGIFIGIWLDTARTSDVRDKITGMDLEWNDARLQSSALQTFSKDFCESAVLGNLEFNNRIYKEGLKIEEYEKINRFDASLVNEKKRYALLQFQFWLNSVNIRKICNTNYSTLIYLYSHYDKSLDIKQEVQSTILAEVKKECGDKVMLIPLPSDIGLIAIDAIKEKFRITSAPAILIDEKLLFEGRIVPKDDIIKNLAC